MYNIDRNTPKWTPTARECYKIGCNCRKCLLFIILGYRCKMKQAVFELVRKFGAPPVIEESLFTGYQLKILYAIKNGCDTVAEIAAEVNKPESSVSGTLHVLYKKARMLGWNPRQRGIVTQSLLPQFVKWVRGKYED